MMSCKPLLVHLGRLRHSGRKELVQAGGAGWKPGLLMPVQASGPTGRGGLPLSRQWSWGLTLGNAKEASAGSAHWSLHLEEQGLWGRILYVLKSTENNNL